MSDRPTISQKNQTVTGSQTNAAGDINGPVFPGHFELQGDFIYNETTKIRLPFQRPRQVPHFTGREAELASLLRDFRPGHAVTICGPGGMGKTALAAEVIWQLAPASDPLQLFPDGIVFHTFYHKPQPELALEAIARAYGEDPRQNPLDAAKRALAGRRALIVLDGAEACEDLQAVLSVTGSCGVLITTRHRGDAPEEANDLLPLPEDNAVELLRAWGGSMAADEGTCHSICSLLGRLPLAIYLAGRYLAHRRQMASDYLAWLEETPLEALDLGKRQHQSIPLLMEHSLLQVSEQARCCLGLAGVLAMKPFEAEVIAIGLQVSAQKANFSLGELVDYGMLTRPDARYQISHALAHTYARKRISVQNDVLARLAQHYNKFSSEQRKLGLSGYSLLDAHRGHILAVQSACNRAGLLAEARAIVWAIEDYLDLQGHSAERMALLQIGLEAARSDGTKYDEASFLNLLGLAYAALGDAKKAIEYYEQALAISCEIGDRRGEGTALGNLGLAYADLGDAKKAIEYYEQALAISREIGDRRGEASASWNLGLAFEKAGDLRRAAELMQICVGYERDIGHQDAEKDAVRLEAIRAKMKS